jgi:hypothetical protein
MAEWDDDQAETAAWISGVEPSEPYALLLADGLIEQIEDAATGVDQVTGPLQTALETGPDTKTRLGALISTSPALFRSS